MHAKRMTRFIALVLVGLLAAAAVLTGCSAAKDSSTKDSDKLTVYLWDPALVTELTPYLHEQLPDKDIEFISGNNDADLYSYLSEHGELPDIITVRRFAGTDTTDLQPYLMDFTSYDVTSEFSSYSLQYYKSSDGQCNWLPICGIPQTIIANKTLFDKYGLDLPESYEDYVKACKVFHDNGIKPYSIDLAQDWSSHEMVQAGGIGELTSLDGIAWRAQAESAQGDIEFDSKLWGKVFKHTKKLLEDSYLTEDDLEVDTATATQLFIDGKAAMFHGSPVNLIQCQQQMDDELVRIPYFSQTSDEGFIYMTPSLHVAFNKDLESNADKLETAMDVLELMLSSKGQKIIANGNSIISFNPGVASLTDGMTGLEEEIDDNQYYIRYSSQKSFAASTEAVRGLLTKTMSTDEAFETFCSVINSSSDDDAAAATVTFENSYSLALNANGGRDAASSILTTVKDAVGAQLAFAPCYQFTSSIYEGECTQKRAGLMICNSSSPSPLYCETLTGAQVKELVQGCLVGTVGDFAPQSKYELPVASGMKLVVRSDGQGYALEDILVDGASIDDAQECSIILTDGAVSNLDSVKADCNLETLADVTFTSVWTQALADGQQPAQPQDYIEVRD